MRVFVDTNIIISAILFPSGKTARVFSYLLEKHTVIISSYTKEECEEVFKRKFPLKRELLDVFLMELVLRNLIVRIKLMKSNIQKFVI